MAKIEATRKKGLQKRQKLVKLQIFFSAWQNVQKAFVNGYILFRDAITKTITKLSTLNTQVEYQNDIEN